MKTRSRIPFSSVICGKCSRTVSFMRVRFTVFWIPSFSHHVCQILQCNKSTTSTDFFLYELEQLIFCFGLKGFAGCFLLIICIVTAVEPYVAIPMVFGFSGDQIAFQKESNDTIFPQNNCLGMYLFGKFKLLERMICIGFITTEETQITI